IVTLPSRSCSVVEQASEAAGFESAPPAPAVTPPVSANSRTSGEPPAAPRWAWSLLLLLFAMKLFDSVDRWLLAALLPKVRLELDLSESQAGWLSTLTLVGIALASPLIGSVVDRVKRPRLMAIGFAIWSLATISTALVRTNDQMQAAR